MLQKNINCKVKGIISSITLSNEAHIFFEEAYVKEAIRDLNKNSSPGPYKITPELIQNGEKPLITCITILLQDCYLLGCFPKCWKQDNRIYMTKKTKITSILLILLNFYRPISLSNIVGKIYENTILQEAVNLLTESKSLMEKMFVHIKKIKIPQALLPLIKQMSEVISSGKYGVLVMAHLEGAFDAVCRNGDIYKLHRAGLVSNLIKFLKS